MSYSRFHYVEKALEEIDSNLLVFNSRNYGKYSSSVAIVYLALLVSQTYNDYTISVQDCFNDLDLPENFKLYYFDALHDYFDKELTTFRGVPVEEMKEYIVEAEKFFSQEYMKVPWGICSLANMILDLTDSDDVVNMCCGDGTYLFNTLKNYDVNSLEGKDIDVMRNAIIEMMAEIQGLKVTVNTESIFNYVQSTDLPKTYDKEFALIPWGLEVNAELKKYSELTGYKCPKSDSQPLYIHSIIDHLSKNGKAVVCVNNSMLMSNLTGIQQYLVENGYLEAVIQLAPNLMNVTSIPCSLFVLSFGNKKVRFINATNIFTPARRGKNELSLENISAIFDMYTTDSKFSITVSNKEISNHEYKLLTANYLFKPRLNYKTVNQYEKLINLCTVPISRGVQFKSGELDNNDTSIPTDNHYLSITGIKDNEIISELPNLLEIDEKYLTYCLTENDIVISASIATVPKVAIATNIGSKKIIVGSNLYIIRLDSSKINPKFVKILLESKTMLDLVYTFNQSLMISVDFLKGIEIPMPSIEEQNKIVEKYENIKTQIKNLKEGISKLEKEQVQVVGDCLGDIE